MSHIKRTGLFDSIVILLFACALVWPLLRLKYLDNWASIESTFIADSRMLGENLPHPGWQPLWYCGTRFDYIYPPALRYGTALIARVAHVVPARAYHLYTGILYALGIAAVYWLVRLGSGSRLAAWLSSFAAALLSPSLLLLTELRRANPDRIPQRLAVLVQYGEGPHMSALAILPAALGVAFVALRTWHPVALVAASLLCALTVANNFYGATALAIFFPIVVWSVWLGVRDWSVWLRATGIAALAYGFSAFWLTPSYLKITTVNLRWVAQPASRWSPLVVVIVLAIFCFGSYWWANRRPERSWAVFVTGSVWLFGVYVLSAFYFHFLIAGAPQRLVPELDLVILLLWVLVIVSVWQRAKTPLFSLAFPRALAVLLTVLMFLPALRYLRHAYILFRPEADVANQYEYRITKWVHENLPEERVLPSGSNRFWFNAWFDNAQAHGGSEQGMLNQNLQVAAYQVFQGERGELALLWLQALGTDATIVTDKSSPEVYHDWARPEKFRGIAPVLFDDRKGTVIYRVPRVYPGIGRVIDRAKLARASPIAGGDDVDGLSRYDAAIEDPKQPPARVSRKGFDEFDVEARLGEAQDILIQETYDPAWHAYDNGRTLSIRPEPIMGFMLIDAGTGEHKISLRFETPLENRIGWGLFALSVAASAILLVWNRLPAAPVS